MKLQYLFTLLLAVLIGVTYWYQSTAYICPIPLEYRVGEVDTSFDLSINDAELLALKAEEQWEETVNRNLFVLTEDADFTVNFIFDDRQERTNEEERQRRFLDGQLAENEQLFEAVDVAQEEFEKLSASYEVRLEQYESRLAEYNQTVRQFNDQGGAPEEEFAALEDERQSLETEAAALESTVTELNTLASRINRLSAEGNRLIDSYNEDVKQYNNQFGFGEIFTQGDYQGDAINIYEFSNENELQAVLLHEFGHALGIEHVEASSSIMYYLLEDVDTEPLFGAADLEAYKAVCGSGKEWDQLARQAIRNFLAIF